MDRIQRSGLVALLLLLAVGAAGIFIGPRKVSNTSTKQDEVQLNPGELPMVEPVPPAKRQLAFSAERFSADPVEHPLKGGGGRSINNSASWTPEAARSVAAELTPPELRAASASAETSSVATASSAISIDFSDAETGVPNQVDKLSEAMVVRTIRIREGETLSMIAQRELGSTKHLNLLANFNNIKNVNAVRLGQELRIPDLTKYGVAAEKAGKSDEPPQVTESPNQWRSYTVVAGDIGGRISQKMYGTSKLWKKIMQANDISDARSLRPGQVLRIPPVE